MHFVFARMGMAEEQGLGLDSLRNGARQQSLPLPRFTWDDPYLVLTLYRSAEAAAKTLSKDTVESMSRSEKKGWQWIATKETMTSIEYADALGLPYRTAMNHLRRFQELGLLEKAGAGRATKYRVLRP
jgi:ATP-dependent DNA helicase RecG